MGRLPVSVDAVPPTDPYHHPTGREQSRPPHRRVEIRGAAGNGGTWSTVAARSDVAGTTRPHLSRHGPASGSRDAMHCLSRSMTACHSTFVTGSLVQLILLSYHPHYCTARMYLRGFRM